MSDEIVPTVSRADARMVSIEQIDRKHARFLRDLTGSATVEERDTWPLKASASDVVLRLSDAELSAEVALVSSGHEDAIDNLATLISDVGEDVGNLRAAAAIVKAKSRTYKELVGIASRVRREAKEAILQATDESVPVDQVAAAVEAVNVAMGVQIAAAISEWQST